MKRLREPIQEPRHDSRKAAGESGACGLRDVRANRRQRATEPLIVRQCPLTVVVWPYNKTKGRDWK
jgi:hypothetical protein